MKTNNKFLAIHLLSLLKISQTRKQTFVLIILKRKITKETYKKINNLSKVKLFHPTSLNKILHTT